MRTEKQLTGGCRLGSDASLFYDKWAIDRSFLMVPAQAIVGQFLKTFEEFPPRQKPASFNIDEAVEKTRRNEKNMAIATGGEWNKHGNSIELL